MKRSKDKKAIRAGLNFLADALDKLPDDEAVEIFNSIMAAYDEAAESQPSVAPAYGLAFVLAPAMTTADPGRPRGTSKKEIELSDEVKEAIIEVLKMRVPSRPKLLASIFEALKRLELIPKDARQAEGYRVILGLLPEATRARFGSLKTFNKNVSPRANVYPDPETVEKSIYEYLSSH